MPLASLASKNRPRRFLAAGNRVLTHHTLVALRLPGKGLLGKVIPRFLLTTLPCPAPYCLIANRRVRSWRSAPKCLLHPPEQSKPLGGFTGNVAPAWSRAWLSQQSTPGAQLY